MLEPHKTENRELTREDLLQRTVESLFSLVRQIHRGAAPQDLMLSQAQARLMFTIAKCSETGISVKELARLSHMTPGAITQFADALIEKGFVSREEDPDDRRVVRLRPTAEAQSRMRDFKRGFVASLAGHFDVLTTSELRELNGLLNKVSAASRGNDAPAS